MYRKFPIMEKIQNLFDLIASFYNDDSNNIYFTLMNPAFFSTYA